MHIKGRNNAIVINERLNLGEHRYPYSLPFRSELYIGLPLDVSSLLLYKGETFYMNRAISKTVLQFSSLSKSLFLLVGAVTEPCDVEVGLVVTVLDEPVRLSVEVAALV